MKRYERIALLAAVFSGCGMSGGGGTVLETGTGKPVAGATVVLECRRDKLHGSEVIKEVRTVTDAAGHFSFATSEVFRCDHAYVKAEKEGYVLTAPMDLRYGHDQYSTIPNQIVLTPTTEATMQRLHFLAAMAKGTSPTRSHEYMVVYAQFSEAKRIAKADRERAFVVISFCGRLTGLYSGLSTQDKARLRGQSIATFGGGPAVVDHEGQVEPYCKGAN